jgi:hypothetical protein
MSHPTTDDPLSPNDDHHAHVGNGLPPAAGDDQHFRTLQRATDRSAPRTAITGVDDGRQAHDTP